MRSIWFPSVIAYLGLSRPSLLIRDTAKAPLCETNATGDTGPAGTGSLYSGMNIVS